MPPGYLLSHIIHTELSMNELNRTSTAMAEIYNEYLIIEIIRLSAGLSSSFPYCNQQANRFISSDPRENDKITMPFVFRTVLKKNRT